MKPKSASFFILVFGFSKTDLRTENKVLSKNVYLDFGEKLKPRLVGAIALANCFRSEPLKTGSKYDSIRSPSFTLLVCGSFLVSVSPAHSLCPFLSFFPFLFSNLFIAQPAQDGDKFPRVSL